MFQTISCLVTFSPRTLKASDVIKSNMQKLGMLRARMSATWPSMLYDLEARANGKSDFCFFSMTGNSPYCRPPVSRAGWTDNNA